MSYKRILGFLTILSCVAVLGLGSNAQAKIKKIKFSSKEVTIGIGESKKLSATVKPKSDKKKVKYTSYNKKIVTVTKTGKLRGKKKGATHILVRATDGSKKKAKLKVRVIRKAKSVAIISNLGDKVYEPNTTFVIQAAVLPKTATYKKLKWSSSSKSIASITSQGVVTTKSQGTATITATATDGTKKKVSCKLKVVVPVKGISLASGKTTVLVQKNSKVKVDSVVSPADASDSSLSWSSSDNGVATVSTSGYVTGNRPGIATIIATAKDGSNVSAMVTVQVLSLTSTDTKFIAHRGLSSDAPENTEAAFRRATQFNYWGIECDIWETTDHEFAISHDESLSRMCGVDRKVTDMTLEEATSYTVIAGNGRDEYPNEKITSLDTYLSILRDNRNAHAVIELKMNDLSEMSASLLISKIYQYGLADRATFISFNQSSLEAMMKADTSDGMIGYQLVAYNFTQDNMDWCTENGADFSCKYTGIDKEQIDLLHKDDIKVSVWTVDDFYQAYSMIKDNDVDYLTSNTMHFE